MSAGVVLFQGVIGAMHVVARKDFAGAAPFVLTVDGRAWDMTMKEADNLAAAARRCRYAINRASRELPFKEGVRFTAYPVIAGADDVVIELGVEVVDDEAVVVFRFDRERETFEGEDAGSLLTAFERFGEAVSDIRRANRPPPPRMPTDRERFGW